MATRTGFTNIRQFNQGLDKAWKASIDELTTRQKALSFLAFKGIIGNTPVKKGRLRGGWTMQVAVPDERVPPPVGKNAKLPPPAPGSLAGLKAFDVVYINNQLPYAVAIEDGHGGRPPGVMVEHTLNVLAQEATFST
jgi:hypothetical protein